MNHDPAMLGSIEKLAGKYDVDSSAIRGAKVYYSYFQKLEPERNEDLAAAEELRNEFVSSHPFWDHNENKRRKV